MFRPNASYNNDAYLSYLPYSCMYHLKGCGSWFCHFNLDELYVGTPLLKKLVILSGLTVNCDLVSCCSLLIKDNHEGELPDASSHS